MKKSKNRDWRLHDKKEKEKEKNHNNTTVILQKAIVRKKAGK
jgi:hypothetical protein